MKIQLELRKSLALLVALGLAPLTGRAETPSGAAFLKINPSARTFALGGWNAALSFGSQAIGANPANLGIMRSPVEVMTSYASLMGDVQYGHVAASMKRRGQINGIGVSATYQTVEGGEARDEFGNKSQETPSAQDTAVSVSMSGRLGKRLKLGATGRALQSELAGFRSKMSMGGDVGISLPLTRAFLGLSVNNLGQGIQYVNQRDPLPTSVNAGMAYSLGTGSTLALSARYMTNDKKAHISLGYEQGLGPVFLRAGYRTESGGSGQNLALSTQSGAGKIMTGLSAGLGLRVNQMKLDYAISQQAVEWGMSHRVALIFMWGNK